MLELLPKPRDERAASTPWPLWPMQLRVESSHEEGGIAGTEFTLDADLVLLAMGFLGLVKNGMIDQLGMKLDQRGNVARDEKYMSSVPGVFAAGVMRRWQSLVVWAISVGRKPPFSGLGWQWPGTSQACERLIHQKSRVKGATSLPRHLRERRQQLRGPRP